jgi:hypothetical protein
MTAATGSPGSPTTDRGGDARRGTLGLSRSFSPGLPLPTLPVMDFAVSLALLVIVFAGLGTVHIPHD